VESVDGLRPTDLSTVKRNCQVLLPCYVLQHGTLYLLLNVATNRWKCLFVNGLRGRPPEQIQLTRWACLLRRCCSLSYGCRLDLGMLRRQCTYRLFLQIRWKVTAALCMFEVPGSIPLPGRHRFASFTGNASHHERCIRPLGLLLTPARHFLEQRKSCSTRCECLFRQVDVLVVVVVGFVHYFCVQLLRGPFR